MSLLNGAREEFIPSLLRNIWNIKRYIDCWDKLFQNNNSVFDWNKISEMSVERFVMQVLNSFLSKYAG